MESESPESGIEELLRLSKQTSKMQQDLARKEQERIKRERELADKKQVVHGLKEIKVSVALEQLEPVATPEIIEAVSSLKHQQGSGDLRNLILDLVTELEKDVDGIAGSNPGMVTIERSAKTLAILIELLFSVE